MTSTNLDLKTPRQMKVSFTWGYATGLFESHFHFKLFAKYFVKTFCKIFCQTLTQFHEKKPEFTGEYLENFDRMTAHEKLGQKGYGGHYFDSNICVQVKKVRKKYLLVVLPISLEAASPIYQSY